MDYGDDWPPPPERHVPEPRRRRRLSLGVLCLLAVAGYALIWALGSLLLEIRTETHMTRLGPPAVKVTEPAPGAVAHTVSPRR